MSKSKEEKYIVMCKKAKEIQALWKPKYGDTFIVDYTATEWINGVNKWIIGDRFDPKEFVENFKKVDSNYPKRGIPKVFWLPSQDQLQEMLCLTTYELISNFPSLMEIAITTNKNKNMTLGKLINQYLMKQLWLMFVMYKKFNKIWSGKDWVENDI